jgi:GNAT superfamily N-acetyltransferase
VAVRESAAALQKGGKTKSASSATFRLNRVNPCRGLHMPAILHAGYRPGCIHRIVELHTGYYSREVGFGPSFEIKVVNEITDFMARYNDSTDLLLLGLVDGVIHAALVIDGAEAYKKGAHLRWFIVSDAIRGKGMGQRLLARAIAFTQSRGYKSIYLWTFDELDAARHIYTKFGFRLVRQMLGNRWGKEVNEQMYVLGDG